ncbi:MAG: MBL fold metallo-hydrolase [Chloroflexota bacterium]|nr:MBL fold metallo-hydrolase [Chloroflexota bacterium]
MEIHQLAYDLNMIDVSPEIPGWEEFIGSYIFGRDQLALIDVGPRSTAGTLIDGIKSLHIDPKRFRYILLTHIHIDHAGAIGELLEFLPKAKVVVHPKGASHLTNTGKLWEGSLQTLGDLAEKYGRPQNIPAERIIPAEDGLLIRLGEKIGLEVIYTPGHAAHHMSFLEPQSGVLFAGEAGGVYTSKADLLRPTTPSPFNLEQTMASIDKLLQRNPSTIFYGHFGHGGDASGQLWRHREQLSLWLRVIGRAHQAGGDREAIFSELLYRDVTLEGLKELSEDQYLRARYFINNSINGFLGYVEKLRAKNNGGPSCSI